MPTGRRTSQHRDVCELKLNDYLLIDEPTEAISFWFLESLVIIDCSFNVLFILDFVSLLDSLFHDSIKYPKNSVVEMWKYALV